ncbi:MAG TPA: hypothetical protein DDZ68_16610 [Parvularcula sp.]|nr:hypothetical protein [Parvularcula sp.]HBS32053.1 hypothetical protein [Parvularcula sp.]HBS33848.1 hypothetical protein [Parvularcula sp.]
MKRGIKAPGEFGAADMAGFGLASAAGIVAALVTDYQQKGEASALYTINRWVVTLGEILGFGQVPLWVVVVGLIGLGAGSTFYFQPITRQGAFAQGFGLLAVLMTTVPADLAAGIQSTGSALPDLEPVAYEREAALGGNIMTASFAEPVVAADAARVINVQDRQAARYVVELRLVFPNGVPDDIDQMIRKGTFRGRLHNADTGETYNLFRNAGGDLLIRGDSLIIRAGVPARSQTATLWVRIECDGYSIEEKNTNASLSEPLNWTIEMRPSATPLFLQRLNKSYWF